MTNQYEAWLTSDDSGQPLIEIRRKTDDKTMFQISPDGVVALKDFVEHLVDDMTCKTNPKIGGVELIMCVPINTVELFNKARTLLAELEAAT